MSYTVVLILALGIGLPAGILLMVEAGRRAGIRWRANNPAADVKGLGAIEAAIFALMGLLVAFTFSGAASRFERRRELIVLEANFIGTAWLRLDLLPAAAQPTLQDSFRRYLDSRLAGFRAMPDLDRANAIWAESAVIQREIWNHAVAALKTGEAVSSAPTMLVLSSLNDMFDITSVRAMTTQSHPPTVVFVMLFIMVLACSLFAGFGMASASQRSWIHIIGFAVLTSLSLYVILDLEYPRAGVLRVNASDQVMFDLRRSMQ